MSGFPNSPRLIKGVTVQQYNPGYSLSRKLQVHAEAAGGERKVGSSSLFGPNKALHWTGFRCATSPPVSLVVRQSL